MADQKKFDHIGVDTIYHCKNCGHHHCLKCHVCHRCGCTNFIRNRELGRKHNHGWVCGIVYHIICGVCHHGVYDMGKHLATEEHKRNLKKQAGKKFDYSKREWV